MFRSLKCLIQQIGTYHIASYNYWKEFVVIHQFIANFLDKFELLSFFILLAALLRETIHYNNIINLLTKLKMKKYYSSVYLSFISSVFLFFVSCCLENLRFLIITSHVRSWNPNDDRKFSGRLPQVIAHIDDNQCFGFFIRNISDIFVSSYNLFDNSRY